MKKIEPLQLFSNSRVFEQNKTFHWVVSTSMFINMSTNKIELMHNCISDVMESMGEIPMLDIGMPKPKAEWLISGSFFSPAKTPCSAGQAKVKIGKSEKSIDIFGNRSWIAGIPSNPEPFTSIPLDYQHAFGGKDLPYNPNGMGFKQNNLPNIEHSHQSVTDNQKHYTPAGFSPLDSSWPQRSKYQGTYDKSYMEKYFPGYPEDMDWRLFMNASSDQWFDNFLIGDEEYQLENLHPEKPLLKGKLPGLYPRCFIKDEQEIDNNLQFKEVNLHLDTAWFFPDKDIVQLIWRGGMIVSSDEAEQISHLLIGYESSENEKRSSEYYLNALERRIKSKDPLLNSLNTQDLIPEGEASALQLMHQSAMENTAVSNLGENLEEKSQAIQAVVDEKIEESISDLKDKLNSPILDQAQKDNILEQVNALQQPAKKDIESTEFLKKIDDILPGINSGNPKDLDLSDFSFDKIADIFDEVDKFMDKKKSQALAIVQPEITKLTAQLDSDKVSKQLDDIQKEKIKQQIDSLESLFTDKKPANAISALPRIDVDMIKHQIESSSPEIQQAKQELHLLLSNPFLADSPAIKTAKDKLLSLESVALSSFSENVTEMKNQFFESYRIGAHFSDTGLSPHSDNDIQKQKLISIINGNKDASNQDWACLDLSGLNLDKVDFSNCFMEQVNLSNTSLKEANFSGTILARATFKNTNCSQTNFDHANIGSSTCIDSNFTDSSFIETKLSKSSFENCNFSLCRIEQPEALDLKLEHCNFNSSKIEGWPFLDIFMTGITFDQASMKTCTFINSKLHDCSFVEAVLPSTAWANSSIRNTSFLKANMSGNCFVSSEETDDNQDPCYFEELDFSQANLEKSNFQGLNLRNNNFSQSQISSSNFTAANLSHCNFDDCHGNQTQFRKAILTGASMKRANLMEAILSKTIITGTNLESANLYGVDFLRSTVKDTRFNNANLDATILRDWRPS